MERSQSQVNRLAVREQLTPVPVVSFYSETIDRNDSAYTANSPIPRGTLYSSITGGNPIVVSLYPLLYFLKEIRVPNSDNLVKWLWSTDSNAEDTHNAEISYISESVAHPAYSRVYTIRRDVYEASPSIATGTALTGLLGVKITAGGTGYVAATTTATFGVAGTGASVQFVVSGGVIISCVVLNEGTGFTAGSTITIGGTGAGATATCIVQPVGCTLVGQKKMELPDDDPYAQEFVRVLRVYRTLPGPILTSVVIDPETGASITTTKQDVATGSVSPSVSGLTFADGVTAIDSVIQERIKKVIALPNSWEELETLGVTYQEHFKSFTYVEGLGSNTFFRPAKNRSVLARAVFTMTNGEQTAPAALWNPDLASWQMWFNFNARDVFSDGGTYSGSSGSLSFSEAYPASSPTRTAYLALVALSTEVLYQYQSKRWESGVFSNKAVYITLI